MQSRTYGYTHEDDGGPFLVGGPGPWPFPLNPALLLWQNNGRKNDLISWTVTDVRTWVAEPFLKWGGTSASLKGIIANFVV